MDALGLREARTAQRNGFTASRKTNAIYVTIGNFADLFLMIAALRTFGRVTVGLRQ
jgi:hypothetical protein